MLDRLFLLTMSVLPLLPEDYADHDSFEDAMDAVTQDMDEPWSWNDWTKMCYALRTSYPMRHGIKHTARHFVTA